MEVVVDSIAGPLLLFVLLLLAWNGSAWLSWPAFHWKDPAEHSSP